MRYDLLNLIPPQSAGAIALQGGLAEATNRWCEVNHVTFESVKQPGVHVIGDATTGLPVPKSGNIANATGKICATAIVHRLNGQEPPVLAPGNTCYSWVSDREAIAVVNAYRIDAGKVVQIEQKLTPRAAVSGRPELARVADQHLERHPRIATKERAMRTPSRLLLLGVAVGALLLGQLHGRGRTARRPGRAEGARLQRLPRLRRQQPRGHRSRSWPGRTPPI